MSDQITVGSRVQNKRYPSLFGRVTGIGSVNNPHGRHFYVDYGVGNKTVLEPESDIEAVNVRKELIKGARVRLHSGLVSGTVEDITKEFDRVLVDWDRVGYARAVCHPNDLVVLADENPCATKER